MSYVVQTGETISAVSKKLKTSFQALKRQNPEAFGQTKDGRWYLKAGFKLQNERPTQTQSAPISASTSSYTPTTSTSNGASSDKTYTVQQGDTIKAVTSKLGYSFQEIKAANPRAVGNMGNGRQFFYAGATLKMPGGFQHSLNAAQRSSTPPAVTTMKPSSTENVISRTSSEPVAAGETYPRANAASRTYNNTQTISHQNAAYGTTGSVETLQNLPYRSPGFVKASNDIYHQNPVIGTSDFIQAGQQPLTQSNYVVEAPLDQDLNLAFGFVTERHDLEDFSHSRQGIDSKGVTMGLRFRF